MVNLLKFLHPRAEQPQAFIKIKSLTMQSTRILQAVVLMMIVAVAASCAASREYSSKLFSPRSGSATPDPATALRFLELDSLQSDQDGWVTTDIIMGRDTVSRTLALDKLAKTFPAVPPPKDTAATGPEEKTIPVLVVTSPVPATDQPVARSIYPEETRNKRTREK